MVSSRRTSFEVIFVVPVCTQFEPMSPSDLLKSSSIGGKLGETEAEGESEEDGESELDGDSDGEFEGEFDGEAELEGDKDGDSLGD